MAQHHPDGNWLVGLAFTIVGGIGAAIGTIVTVLVNRPKTQAEAGKTGAEKESIQVTAEVNLSDAALRIVERLDNEIKGLRDELKSVREAHRLELAELKGQNRELKEAYDAALLERHHLQARCERLEARINELSKDTNLVPLPEGGFDDEVEIP